MSNRETSNEIELAFQEFLKSATSTMENNMYMEPDLKNAINDLVTGAYDAMTELRGVADTLDEDAEEEDAPERLTGHEMGVCPGRV